MDNNEAYKIPLGNVFWLENQDRFSSKKQLHKYQTNQSVPTGTVVENNRAAEILRRKRTAYCNIPDSVLLVGAGYAQIQADTKELSFWSTFFDDPRDTYRALQGIELYWLWYE